MEAEVEKAKTFSEALRAGKRKVASPLQSASKEPNLDGNLSDDIPDATEDEVSARLDNMRLLAVSHILEPQDWHQDYRSEPPVRLICSSWSKAT